MLTEQQKNDIKNEVDNWTETLLFYFQEYSGSRGENRYEIADTFIDEFSKLCLGINLNLMSEVD